MPKAFLGSYFPLTQQYQRFICIKTIEQVYPLHPKQHQTVAFSTHNWDYRKFFCQFAKNTDSANEEPYMSSNVRANEQAAAGHAVDG